MNVISLLEFLVLSIEPVFDVGAGSVEMWEMSLRETDGKTIPSHIEHSSITATFPHTSEFFILLNQNYDYWGWLRLKVVDANLRAWLPGEGRHIYHFEIFVP